MKPEVGQIIYTSWGCDVRQSRPYSLTVTKVLKRDKFYAKFEGNADDPFPYGRIATLYQSNFEPKPKENANADCMFTFGSIDAMEKFIKDCMQLDVNRRQKIIDTFCVKR